MTVKETHKKQYAFFSTQQTKNPSFRKNSLKRFQSVLKAKENSITDALASDLGKAPFEAFVSEYFVVMTELRTMIKNLEQWSKPRRVSTSIINFPSKDYLLPDLWMFIQISPWNYPFQLSLPH